MASELLRRATNADGESVRDLVFSVLREYSLEPDPDGVDSDLADIESSYLTRGGSFDVLVDTEGTILGSVGIYPVDGTICELRKMYLAPHARGRGLGKILLEHALAQAAALGFSRVLLETSSALKEAIGLYRRYGFRPYQAAHVCNQCDEAYYLDLTGPKAGP